ncbi:flavin reductase [Komagataeibacter xylinus]|uniref:flavin reductase n=1 Tax=Komagataeibacter xylinus TaxID=28448 RepID=UPI00280B576E|nr:flavin reductase [Komagataeibacter xylinus]
MQSDTIMPVEQVPDVTGDLFRNAMSRLGAPVTVVTTSGPAGRQGLTVSAITSVSASPPTVLVCLNRDNRSHIAFIQNGVIGISLLSRGHEDLAGIFASSRRTPDEKFAVAEWRTDVTGAPLLSDALVTLDCTIALIHAASTHDVLFCTVEAIHVHPAGETGLTWFNRQFHTLPLLPA